MPKPCPALSTLYTSLHWFDWLDQQVHSPAELSVSLASALAGTSHFWPCKSAWVERSTGSAAQISSHVFWIVFSERFLSWNVSRFGPSLLGKVRRGWSFQCLHFNFAVASTRATNATWSSALTTLVYLAIFLAALVTLSYVDEPISRWRQFEKPFVGGKGFR